MPAVDVRGSADSGLCVGNARRRPIGTGGLQPAVSSNIPWLAPIIALIAICFLCYANTINCYFFCDDFTFLHYMHQAWQGKHNVLVEAFTTPMSHLQPFLSCYRPLPFIIMYFQYWWADANPLWYHLTNVVLHCLNAVIVFFVGKRLLPDGRGAFFAAGLFGAYPLIVEAVNAPVNVVTLSCTTLSLLSVLGWIIWRQNSRRVALASSVGAMALAILCKEQTAVLPLLFTIGTFLWRLPERSSLERQWRPLAAYWLVLAGYVTLRLSVLGPIVGGYQGPVGDWLIRSYADRLLCKWPLTCLFPLNSQLALPSALFTSILLVLYVVAAGLGFAKLAKQRLQINQSALFLICWFALTFAVGIPVWNLEDTLAGARQFYLASVPLLLLFVLATFNLKHRRIWTLVCGALLACFASMSVLNNSAWVHAGNETVAFKQQVEQSVARLGSGQYLVVLNPPHRYEGVYLFSSSDMVRAMFRLPMTRQDINERVETLSPWYIINHDMFSLSRLRRLAASPQHELVYWDSDLRTLRPFHAQFGSGSLNVELTATSRHIDQTNQLSIAEFACDARTLIDQCDLIEITLSCRRLPAVPKGTLPALSLWWQTGPQPPGAIGAAYNNDHCLYLPVIDDGAPHTYRFTVSNSMRWMLSPRNGIFRVCLPSPNFANDLQSVHLYGWRRMTPAVEVVGARLPSETLVGTPACGREDAAAPTLVIGHDGVVMSTTSTIPLNIDASCTKGASGMVLEVSRRNGLLEAGIPDSPRSYLSPYCAKRVVLKKLIAHTTLTADELGAPGTYEVEAAAVDVAGKPVSFFSDPVFINLQSPGQPATSEQGIFE